MDEVNIHKYYYNSSTDIYLQTNTIADDKYFIQRDIILRENRAVKYAYDIIFQLVPENNAKSDVGPRATTLDEFVNRAVKFSRYTLRPNRPR